jgi:hypothetical protein
MTDFLITAPLHEETRGKIRTQLIITRWMAWREGENADICIGFGDTEDAAKLDLLELWSAADARNSQASRS